MDISTLTLTPELLLSRTLHTCLLWENLKGVALTTMQTTLRAQMEQVSTAWLVQTILEARRKHKMRFSPLVLLREMARLPKHKAQVAATMVELFDRADDLTKFLTLYWQDNPKAPVSSQVRKGLALAFPKFTEYQLARNQGSAPVTLRDVMFICRPTPKDAAQGVTWKLLANKALPAPDMWEKALSVPGADKLAIWSRMLSENKLGTLSLIRNLRNMLEAGVKDAIIRAALANAEVDRTLPFQFLTAFRQAPTFEQDLQKVMFKCLQQQPVFGGKTVFVIDISGSMGGRISHEGETTRLDTAIALGILIREQAENAVLYATAGDDAKEIHATASVDPGLRGFAMFKGIKGMNHRLGSGGIFLTQVMNHIAEQEKTADRVIILTDEEDCDHKLCPNQANAFGTFNYIINISANNCGVAYSRFSHINGWSEGVLDFIRAEEELYRQLLTAAPVPVGL